MRMFIVLAGGLEKVGKEGWREASPSHRDRERVEVCCRSGSPIRRETELHIKKQGTHLPQTCFCATAPWWQAAAHVPSTDLDVFTTFSPVKCPGWCCVTDAADMCFAFLLKIDASATSAAAKRDKSEARGGRPLNKHL